MSYSITFTICFCWLLCGTATEAWESTTDDTFQGINNVAEDFNAVNTTSKSGHSATSTWMWKPVGHEMNKVKSESILRYFKDDTAGSGDDFEDDTESEKDEPLTEDGNWLSNETIDLSTNTTQSPPKTFDTRRNESEEKAYLFYEKQLRKRNWCFKETEDAKSNSKFKKTQDCCRTLRECRARRLVKSGIYQCSCDIYFHICLKKADTKMARSIERMYFDRKIVCYKTACTRKPCSDAIYVWKIIPHHLK